MAKRLIKKITAVALSAVSATALAFGVAGCAKKSVVSYEEPEDAVIARLTPPDDGSLPTAHTCAENLAYIAHVFDGQTQYHTYSYGVTGASIATQVTRNFRDYKDGVLITTDLTFSSIVKGGTQTCTLINEDGEYEIYYRTSGEPGANTLPTEADWSQDAPYIFTERTYHFTYGLPPTELFNYIVNENTIVDSAAVVANPDGTYTLDFSLDPVASTYYYQFGMKTRGGLSGLPEFKSIAFSVTFDGKWQILSSYMHEVSMVNKGIIVESISDFTTEYWYGDDHFDEGHYGYYESYYKNYLGNEELEQGGSVDDKFVVDVAGVLSNGFASILNGGDQFELSADLGNNHYEGYIYLSLDLSDLLSSLKVKASLGKKLNARDLYLEYGNGELSAYYGKDFAVYANLAEVKLITDDFGDVIERFERAIAKIVGNKDGETDPAEPPVEGGEEGESDVLGEVMNAMTLVAGEKQAVLTLVTDDLLGLGIGINARLVFAIDGKSITFRGAAIKDLSIGGEALDLSLTLRTTTAPEINYNAEETGANIADYIADVHSLLGADLIKIGLTLDGTGDLVKIAELKNLDAKLTVYADIDGLTVGADADVAYYYRGNKISAKLSVWYGYDPAQGNYGEAIVNLTELNGVAYNISLKCDIKQVADAVSSAVTLAGADLGGATDGLVEIINGALSSDLSALLTEVYADDAQIKIGVSVDALLQMLNVHVGVQFGTCNLKYARGEGVYGGQLSASLPALGFTLTVEGEQGGIEKPDTENTLDVWYLIEDIEKLANAELLQAKLVLDGSAEGVTIGQLGGIYAQVNAYLTTDDIAVYVTADLSYTYNNDTLSAGITAYYGADEVVLSLTNINGVSVNAGVTCNITEITAAVESLLKYAEVTTSPFDGLGGSVDLTGIIGNLLSADLAKLLPELSTSSDGMAIGVDLDEALALFNVNLNAKLGAVNLLYSHVAEDVLSVSVPALGLRVSLNGANDTIEKPSTEGYLDLTDLVTTVEQAWKNVDGIIDGQAISFRIDGDGTYLLLDGIRVRIWGEGEVSWKQGNEYVALDFGFGMNENGGAADEAKFRLIYTKNADGDTPLVRVALNEVGLDIYPEDIDRTVEGFNSIYEKIKPLLGGSSASTVSTYGVRAYADGEKNTANDRLFGIIFGLLADKGWVDILNNFTLQSDSKSVTLGYLQDNCVKITADEGGDLTLYYKGKLNERFSLGGSLTASAVSGSIVKALGEKIESESIVTSTRKDGNAKFIRLAYDFLFDGINSIGVANILGSDTYAVNFKLDGTDTGVKELEEVYIDVQLYYTNAGNDHGRFAEINLDINVMGVAVDLNVICEYIGNQVYFYMNLKQVMDIALPDLKFMATQDSLYETLQAVFYTVNDTNILEFVGGMFGLGGESQPAPDTGKKGNSGGTLLDDGETVNKLCDVIEKLLNLNFNDILVATEVDGTTYATLHVDSLLKQLGVTGGEKLHDVEFEINHDTHFIKTSGKVPKVDKDGNETEVIWIYLSSARTERKSYESFAPSTYVSIEFLPDLLKDLVNFATDDDSRIYSSYTLSGTINAAIDLSIIKTQLKIDVRSLTLNLDKDGGISFSGVLHFNKMSVWALIVSISIPDTTVGITYKNGMLTLAKGITTATPEYKVMTFDYFIDHLLVQNGSVLEWWLDIGGFNGVMNLLNNSLVKSLMGGELKVSSGIENTEDVYLYETKQTTEVSDIYMKDFVEAIRVVIGGNTKTNYVADAKYAGRMDQVSSTLGLGGSDYYGFSINASRVTNNVFDELIAAITRTEERGITGLKAFGDIKNGLVKLNVDLGYNEGMTEEYALGDNDRMTDTKCAPDFYTNAVSVADKLGVKYDFNYYLQREKEATDICFGCLSVSEKSGYSSGVDYSYPRHSVILTVVNLDGTTQTIAVKQGSTVYMYDNAHPVYTDDGKQFRLLYTLTAGTFGETSFVMNGDTTVYALGVKAVTVKFLKTDGSEYAEGVNSEYDTFVGDRMPTSAIGMEAIDGPYYDIDCKNNVGANDRVPDGVDRITLYGTFARGTVTVDGVIYEFINGSYTATGRAAAGFNEKYVENREILYLQSHIDGYPVTAIGAKAFANTELNTDTGERGKPMYGIVVPATVTTVGENAFLDNVDMQLAVFLADSVTFLGKDGSSKTMPFYGCSIASDEEKTELTVYYNKITASGGKWNQFRYVNKVISFYFNIGEKGGRTVSSNWEYAKVVVENSTEYDVTDLINAHLTDGLHEGINNASAAQTEIMNAINADCAVKGFIDGYAVSVTAQKDSYGYTVYTVTVTPAEAKYPVVIKQNANATIKVTGESVVTFNGTYYACGEITVTCTDIKYGCEFVNFTVNGAVYGENPAVIAVTGAVEIGVNLKANLYATKLVSAIDFNYDGLALSAGENSLELVETGGKITLLAPTATGYTFLGWAKEVGGALQFTGAAVTAENGATYYAIWGGSKVGAAFTTSVATSGSALPAVSGGVNKWFDDNWNEVTQISKQNTVVYTRHQFTVSYSISGNVPVTIKDSLYNTSKLGYSVSNSFTVLEGQRVTASTSGKTASIYVDGVEKVKLTITMYNVKSQSYENGSVSSNIDLAFKF